jgi:transcriptional regulator with XRE-family HTH domain
MNSVNQRIKQIRSELGISQREFSKQVFISQTTLGEIETGVRKVNNRIIELISSRFNVSRDFLRDGKGKMFDTKKPDITFEHLTEVYNQLNKPLQKYLLEHSELVLKLQKETTHKK